MRDTQYNYNKNHEKSKIEDTEHNQATMVTGVLIPPHTLLRIGRGNRIDSGGAWQVRVRCPWCGKLHFHGWDPSEPWTEEVGRRVSHCVVPGITYAGYTIVINTESEDSK